MKEYIDIGPTPCDENCTQVGDQLYAAAARRECRAFLNQLVRQFGPAEKHHARLAIKSFPHDFGHYMEVVCYYDTDAADSADYAFLCESHAWTTWDAEAKKELGLA
jgi:hypothetical protein